MVTENKTYNGWTNYETWCVSLWLDNDNVEGADDLYVLANDKTESLYNKSQMLKSEVSELRHEFEGNLGFYGMFSDLLTGALDKVNWREIIEFHIEEDE
ncbi:MAG TPA: hypothetical protein EYQ21_02540 [Flavobacteriales bacterium]|jgi:hypothetical protein|nr:hypothetical protein [Flavobacteriales bacterium]